MSVERKRELVLAVEINASTTEARSFCINTLQARSIYLLMQGMA